MTELYFWGANSHHQSGSCTSDEQFETPIQIDFSESDKILQICGGGGHTIILTNEGKAYAVGWNNKGQCTDGFRDKLSFCFISIDTKIRLVRCGWDISCLVSDNNELFMFGNNQYEQFGIKNPKFTEELIKIQLPKGFQDVSDVSFGLRHSALLTLSGKLLLFGQSRCLRSAQEMKLPETSAHKHKFNDITYLEIQFPFKISHITSGQHFTLAYSRTSNRLFMIGENKQVSLCNQEIDLTGISGFIREISSGWTHTAILDDAGIVYTFGRNNYHQLGRKTSTESKNMILKVNFKPQESIKTVSCGSEHTAVITESGKILTWGWNEHGNCGVNGIEDVKTPTEVKLPGICKVLGTGCGFCFALIKR